MRPRQRRNRSRDQIREKGEPELRLLQSVNKSACRRRPGRHPKVEVASASRVSGGSFGFFELTPIFVPQATCDLPLFKPRQLHNLQPSSAVATRRECVSDPLGFGNRTINELSCGGVGLCQQVCHASHSSQRPLVHWATRLPLRTF